MDVRKVVLNIGFSVLGLVLALILAEAGFRAFMHGPAASRWDDRPALFYMPEGAPNMADRAYPVPKPEHHFRIAVIGDSFSFGPRLQFDDTYAKRLERMLNLNRDAEVVEVVNYSLPGDATVHEVRMAAHAIAEGADLLLLQITLNDPEVKPLRNFKDLPYMLGPFVTPPRWEWLLTHWKSLRFVLERVHNSITVSEHVRYYRDLYSNQAKWNQFSRALGKIAAAAEDRSIPLGAVIFPLFDLPINERYPFAGIHKQIEAHLQKLGVPTLDLRGAYMGIPPERLQVVPGIDPHPNEIGHRIAAEKIYQFLKRQGFNIPPEVFARKVSRHRESINELAIRRRALVQ